MPAKFIDTNNKYPYSVGQYNIYANANLYVNVLLPCNCSCEFCIAETDWSIIGRQKSSEQFWKNLDSACSFAESINCSVTVTGGEPTIDPRFSGIIDRISKSSLRQAALNTNLTGLVDNEDCLTSLLNSNFSHINISRHHYDCGENQRLMRYPKPIDDQIVRELINNIIFDSGIRPRFQSSLSKDGLNSLSDVLLYIDMAIDFGVDHVSIFEFADMPKDSVYSKSVVTYSKNNRARICSILADVSCDQRFTLIRKIQGAYYYEEVYRYKNQVDILFKSSDLQAMMSFDETSYIDALILHSDGTLAGSWVPGKKVLSRPIRENVLSFRSQ